MFANAWNNILDWFRDRSERQKLIKSFNESARSAYIGGVVPTLLKAQISRGDKNYKHQFSSLLNSGFRITAFTGAQLTKEELVTVGAVIMSDNALTRKLVVLGFDTLEVIGDVGRYGCKWQLKDFLLLEYN